MKQKIKDWWLYLLVLISLIIAMLVQDTDLLHVAPVVWYALIGYMLFPYFGGVNTAPHAVHIDLDIYAG